MQQNCNKKRLKNLKFCEKSKNFEFFLIFFLSCNLLTFN